MSHTNTHRPHGCHTGTGTCARCGAVITMIYTAVDLETGEIEPFGSDCHYQVTGVDTRQARAQHGTAAKVARNTARMDPAEVELAATASAAIAGLDRGGFNGMDHSIRCDIDRWVRDWTPGNIALADYIQRATVLAGSPTLVDALRNLPGIDFDKVTGKVMAARFGGTCGTCGDTIRKGDQIVYNGAAHCGRHAA